MKHVQIDLAEAERIMREAMRLADEAAGTRTDVDAHFAALPTQKLMALGGTLNIIAALQNLGYRIAPPLASVKSGGSE